MKFVQTILLIVFIVACENNNQEQPDGDPPTISFSFKLIDSNGVSLIPENHENVGFSEEMDSIANPSWLEIIDDSYFRLSGFYGYDENSEDSLAFFIEFLSNDIDIYTYYCLCSVDRR